MNRFTSRHENRRSIALASVCGEGGKRSEPGEAAQPALFELAEGRRRQFSPGLFKLPWPVRLSLLAAAISLLALPPALSQTDSGGDANPSSQTTVDAQKELYKVNPLTGQVSAQGSDYVPLTGHERWKMYFKQNYWSVGAYFGPFAAALVLDQATGQPEQWGGGFPGYGRRLASRLGGAVIQGSVQAPLAAWFKEDTRYIMSTQHGFKRRAGHALLYGFLTYNNNGKPTLNVANLAGYYAASAASTLWLPGVGNTALYALRDGSSEVGLGAAVNLIQEFWPEISRTLRRHH